MVASTPRRRPRGGFACKAEQRRNARRARRGADSGREGLRHAGEASALSVARRIPRQRPDDEASALTMRFSGPRRAVKSGIGVTSVTLARLLGAPSVSTFRGGIRTMRANPLALPATAAGGLEPPFASRFPSTPRARQGVRIFGASTGAGAGRSLIDGHARARPHGRNLSRQRRGRGPVSRRTGRRTELVSSLPPGTRDGLLFALVTICARCRVF